MSKEEMEDKKEEKKEEKEEKEEIGTNEDGIPEIPPIETEYYEVLGVSPTATRGQIKKAYFLKARKCHPDKNPDNPEAEKEFKLLAEAYEVLYNNELRERYHRFGKESVQQGNFTNPKQLFSMLFGGGRFEHIIGELSFFGSTEEEQTDEEFEKAHEARVISIKEHLVERLKPWMEGRVKAFMEELEKETEELRKESYGSEILQHVGYIYDNEARKYLKGFLRIPGAIANIKEKVHYMSEVFEIVKQGVKVQMAEEALMLAEEEQRIELEPQVFKETVVAMWRIARLDMESAVRDACEQLLKDADIDKPSRKRRAEGIKRIGKYWKGITPEEGKEGAWEYFAEMDSQVKADAAAAKWSMPNYSGTGRKLLLTN